MSTAKTLLAEPLEVPALRTDRQIKADVAAAIRRVLGGAAGICEAKLVNEVHDEIVVEAPLRALEAFNRDRPVNERVLFAAVLLPAKRRSG